MKKKQASACFQPQRARWKSAKNYGKCLKNAKWNIARKEFLERRSQTTHRTSLATTDRHRVQNREKKRNPPSPSPLWHRARREWEREIKKHYVEKFINSFRPNELVLRSFKWIIRNDIGPLRCMACTNGRRNGIYVICGEERKHSERKRLEGVGIFMPIGKIACCDLCIGPELKIFWN